MSSEPQREKRLAIIAVSGVLLLAAAIAAYVYFTRPPQMGASDEAFKEVDALYTAVTARNEKWLGECEERLKVLAASGKLPADAAKELNHIIHTARSGSWQPAAERLHGFMMAQRREPKQP